jgi:hypothetical protein
VLFLATSGINSFMSIEDKTPQTPEVLSGLNSSSPMQSSSVEKDEYESDFLTEPLVGLCPTPSHLMTEEQRREYVVYLRTLRQSYQTYKAEVERLGKERGPGKQAKPVSLKAFEGF